MTIALIFISSFLKAYMDYLQFTYIDSWRNKWKLHSNEPLKEYNKKWYYLWFLTPKYKERFPFSSTILVAFTDPWHKIQMCFLWCVFILIVTYKVQYTWWVDLIGLRVFFGVMFEVFFRYFRRR